MKLIKKIAAIMFAFMMVFTLSSNVNAEETAGTGKITVNDAIDGQTYTVYRILKLDSYEPKVDQSGKDTGIYSYKPNGNWVNFLKDKTAKGGFDYIEIRFDCVKDYLKEHTLEELADWFKNHHLKPWAYNTLIFFNQRDEAGEKEIDEEVDFILKVSKAIGMKMLITVPSFDVKDKSVSEIKEEAVARLRYLSDKVGADMKISLEFCGAPNCSINQFGTAYDVVKAVDRDNVGVTVDTFHFHEMCSRLEDLKAADGKKIFAYHLNDCEDLPLGSCGDDKRLWPGEGVVDHAGIAAALKEIGFDGVCTIEEFRPEYYAMSHEDNVKKAAEVTRDFVQKYFG